MSLPESFLNIIKDIREEKIRGAAWSVRKAITGFLRLFEEYKEINVESLRRAVELVKNANPSMAGLYNLAEIILKTYVQRGAKATLEALRSFAYYQENATSRIRFYAQQIIEPYSIIFTNTFSSNVYNAIIDGRRYISKVYVAESRPGGEGRLLAGELRKAGLDAIVIPDATIEYYIKQSTLVLVGADSISKDACLINKVGTSIIARIAYEHGVPLLAVFESYKVHPELECSRIPIVHRSYPDEYPVTEEYPVFDKTPGKLVKACITEYGIRGFTEKDLLEIHGLFIKEVLS